MTGGDIQPKRERLSAVIAETEGKIFRGDELIAHLERIAATEDDLPGDVKRMRQEMFGAYAPTTELPEETRRGLDGTVVDGDTL
jgi:hypothetical protein